MLSVLLFYLVPILAYQGLIRVPAIVDVSIQDTYTLEVIRPPVVQSSISICADTFAKCDPESPRGPTQLNYYSVDYTTNKITVKFYALPNITYITYTSPNMRFEPNITKYINFTKVEYLRYLPNIIDRHNYVIGFYPNKLFMPVSCDFSYNFSENLFLLGNDYTSFTSGQISFVPYKDTPLGYYSLNASLTLDHRYNCYFNKSYDCYTKTYYYPYLKFPNGQTKTTLTFELTTHAYVRLPKLSPFYKINEYVKYNITVPAYWNYLTLCVSTEPPTRWLNMSISLQTAPNTENLYFAPETTSKYYVKYEWCNYATRQPMYNPVYHIDESPEYHLLTVV